ncbi:MAG: lipoprotein [Magnetococcales bacterium]|nr:lipoprotein [Magnetococcales bacterium]
MLPVLLAALTLFLSACGYKGDLYLPGQEETGGHKSAAGKKLP